MNKNTKKNKQLKIIMIILAIAIIALLVFGVINRDKNSEQNKIVHDLTTGEIVSEELVELYNMSESERVKYYFNLYIDALQIQEYETAYNFLDSKFKNNYFQTLDSFTQYVSSKYSPIISVTYDDLTRMGNYYVLDITFLDIFNSTDENSVGVDLYSHELDCTYKTRSETISTLTSTGDKIVPDTDGKYSNKVLFKGEYFRISYPKDGYEVKAYLQKFVNDELVDEQEIRHEVYQPQRGLVIEGVEELPAGMTPIDTGVEIITNE